MAGEYEPNDSRNVTGMSQQGMGSPGGADQQTGGQRWGGDAQQAQQSNAEGHPNQGLQGSADANSGIEGQQSQFDNNSAQQGGYGGGGGTGQQAQFENTGGQQGGYGGGSGAQLAAQIREHMEVIGADGAHVGTVDKVDGDRIKLTKQDSGMGSHQGHHHYISTGLIAGIEGNQVRLSANGDVAYGMEEEE